MTCTYVCGSASDSIIVSSHVTSCHVNAGLQEAGARAGQGLLEEVEGVVVVQDLDGVGQGDELLTM